MIKSHLFVIFNLLFNSVAAINSTECSSSGHEKWFCRYMAIHDKHYESVAEMKSRMTHLNRQKVINNKMNSDNVQFGLTSRSDLFSHEKKYNNALVQRKHTLQKRAPEIQHVALKTLGRLTPIDWRKHNGNSYVSSIKDQDACGCCFSFAAATVLEFWAAPQGYPKSISPQHLMDCTSVDNYPNSGCDGGLMEYVFDYAKNHPVLLEQDNPYKDKQTVCNRHNEWSHVQIYDYKVLTRNQYSDAEKQMEQLLHLYGPISVGIDSENMDNYQGGIFKADMCGTDIDHAVTIVGYTKNAWIIKNSWGPYWGENGYLYLEKGKNACGVAEYAVYIKNAAPVLKKMPTQWNP